MAARATLFQKEAMSKLNLLLRWLPQLRNIREQIGIGQLGRDVLRNLIEIFIRPSVARHPRVRQIALWIAQPTDEPIRIDLAPDLRQLRTNFAADQLRFTGASNGQ